MTKRANIDTYYVPLLTLLAFAVALLGLSGTAWAQPQYVLRASVISAGNAPVSDEAHVLESTVGQGVTGRSASAAHLAAVGFWRQARPPAGPLNLPVTGHDKIATDEDVAILINVLANDVDPGGGPLSISGFMQPDSGAVEQASDSTLTYTPNAHFHGADVFTYTVTNAGGGNAQGSVTVKVVPVNDIPVFTSTPVGGAAAGEAYNYTARVRDVDGDTLTLTAPTLPAWMTFADNGDATATVRGTPTNAEVGEHAVTLQASDGEVPGEQSFTVTVVLGAPGIPVLATPEDGAEDMPAEATLAWDSVIGAASYALQLATTEEFATPVIDSTRLADTTFVVADLSGSTTYFWRVRSVNSAGESNYTRPFRFTTATNVAVESEAAPAQFRLASNYPNPFAERTTLAFDVAEASHVRLIVFDALGRAVAMLVDGPRAPGRYEATLDGATLPSGLYFYRIEAGGFTATRRMLLAK